ncbi:SMP-30/gluconolactonase/LRE family protein [Roseimaritima ulvae]|uniref:Gluconolactonase n=1 Tax=Roseimaritima ulvae TaxID=980254 RepID=A0A5B9QQI8_9BACT|nr:SMP-30/gluconolactonase/LRE family protein [Roseimaritima ulvae]QEG39775.1 Gluconolactonase precursor [Roseimaritima ulvae]
MKRLNFCGGLLAGLFAVLGGHAGAAAEDAKITASGPVTKIQDGFAFTEGPAVANDGTLYFTDIPNDTIHVLPVGGKIEVFVKPAGHANGLWFDSDGRLLACQMDGQVVAYDRKSKQMTVLAKQYDGVRFNAPNDLVTDAEGGLYFTDPLFRAPQPLPQGQQSVYYLAADGRVTRVSDDLPAPNGIGLSLDGKRLYVIPSQSAKMLVYEVEAAGKLSAPKVFCELKQPAGKSDTGGDGMAMDVEGNLYITTNLGIQVFNPAGKAMGLIEFPEQPANVTFGGPQRKTMYVTARHGLYAVPMPIAGR